LYSESLVNNCDPRRDPRVFLEHGSRRGNTPVVQNLICLSVWFFIIHPIPSVGGRRERLSRVVA